MKRESKPWRRYLFLFLPFMILVVFFYTYDGQVKVANYLFFKFRESRLTEFVEHSRSMKISQISKRSHLSLNYTYILPDSLPRDTTKRFLYLDDILIRDGVKKEDFTNLASDLYSMDFIGFTTFKDGNISFTISGFLDNCFGISYSESGKRPDSNDCGQIIYWQKVGDKWYAWGTT